jgi:hypothetical protein
MLDEKYQIIHKLDQFVSVHCSVMINYHITLMTPSKLIDLSESTATSHSYEVRHLLDFELEFSYNVQKTESHFFSLPETCVTVFSFSLPSLQQFGKLFELTQEKAQMFYATVQRSLLLSFQ